LIDNVPDWLDAGDANHDTPLHIAAARGSLEVLTLLLESGAQSTIANAQGMTPTHVASTVACLDKLMEYDGDVLAIDHFGRCPLFVMAATGRIEAAEKLA